MRHNTRGPWDSIKIKGRIFGGNSGRLQSNGGLSVRRLGWAVGPLKLSFFFGAFYFYFLNIELRFLN